MPARKASNPRFKYGDYLRWHGDERWELHAGEAVAMSPAPSRRHQGVVGGLFQQISTFLRGHRCRVYVAPFDVRLPLGEEADADIETLVQPDISVICDPAKLDDAGCRGAPEWVVEVLSPQTAARDRLYKRDLYEKHGVREYWLVDPHQRSWLRYVRGNEGGFEAPQEQEAQGKHGVSTLPGLEIDWTWVFED